MKLESLGVVMNLKKIRRIMKKYALVCQIRRANKSRVSLQKNLENRYVPNILDRSFRQNRPYRFASTNITYIKHKESFAFLSVIKDLASGEILAWKLSKFMDLALVMDSIELLEKYFKKKALDLSKLLLHSDQGFQYTKLVYHNKVKKLGISQSMSRKGNSVTMPPLSLFSGILKMSLIMKI